MTKSIINKRFITHTIFGIICLICMNGALAADADSAVTTAAYDLPVLLTSAGQAADVLIMKGLCRKAGLAVTLQKSANADSIAGFKTIILVAGGSSKGLGAAKIDVGDEEERIESMLKAARKAKIPVLVFHIGGEARRGALSDRFNKLAAQGGTMIIVASDGDDDGLFKNAAKKNKAEYRHIKKSFESIGVLKELFGLE
jgi:hypothetical protein